VSGRSGWRRGRCLAAVALFVVARPVAAHELRPALLSLTELSTSAGTPRGAVEYDVVWRVPMEAALSEMPLPVLPPQAQRLPGETRVREGEATVHRFRVRLPEGLAGKRLSVRVGVGAGSEVLVHIATADGRTITGRIVPNDPDRASFVVPERPTALGVASAYLKLGVEHILSGIDHLAFVLGLLLLTPVWSKLWRTVTAFTVAHSLTLALAALGLVRVPQAPVEAAIALSIVLVAREAWLLARESGAGLSAPRAGQGTAGGHAPGTRPWWLAFAFGTLHGLGFAGALSEVGLPESGIPLALLSFNIGVELGQLAFVAVALLARALLAPMLGRLSPVWRLRGRLAPAFVIGSLAMFWCLERVTAFR
jgi:hydrogenase/urease accessory protein HupE